MKALLTFIKAISTIRFDQNVLLVILPIYLIFLSSQTVSSAILEYPTVLPSPVVSSTYFPCSKCHMKKGTVDEPSRKTHHETIRVEGHIEEIYGCYGCHNRENLNELRLFNGSVIDLSLSSELCGQCHSTNFKLWQSSLHGKISGKWNGPKKIAPCTGCHDPHRPGYKFHKPEAPPVPPEKTLRWKK